MNKGLAAVAALLIAGFGTTLPASAHAAPACSTGWGSLDKTAGSSTPTRPTQVSTVRGGQHACFDRLVLDLSGQPPHTSVGYVRQVLGDASGQRIALRGGAFLHVVLTGVAASSAAGTPGSSPANLVDVSGWRTFRQVADAGAFEGHDTFGVGVRARLPFRVFVLAGPGTGSRVVIDVAHHW